MPSASFPVVQSSIAACRKFMRRSLNLDIPLGSVGDAIRRHGYVQIDPIDVCGRMHDLILRNRVANYRLNGLLDTLYNGGRREFFEHYIPGRGILVALPIEDYRFLAPAMKRRRRQDGYGGALNAEQKRAAARILGRIRDEGPLGAAALAEGKKRAQTGWGTNGTLAKTALDKLFFHGRLLIARRENFRRIYDLPERVLPPKILDSRPATPRQIERWLVLERLRQRRLVLLSMAQRLLVKDLIAEIAVPDLPTLFCLREDLELLKNAADLPEPSPAPLLLGPLDPIIYDRQVTRRLWCFDYTWEVYVPPHKRTRGYYALPVLAGTRLVGHVDPKAARNDGKLHVQVDVEKGTEIKSALSELATFLGLKLAEPRKRNGIL